MTANQLLEAAGQLANDELEEFMQQVVHLVAKRRCPALTPREGELLRRINQEPDFSRIAQYHDLRARRKAAELDATKTNDLLTLSDWLEEFHAERLEAVAELAQLRGVSLAEMMQTLGIKHLVDEA